MSGIYERLAADLDKWMRDNLGETAVQWHEAAVEDVRATRGTVASDVVGFDRERVRRYWDLVHPDAAQDLSAVFTQQMSRRDIGHLRQAFVETARQGQVSAWTARETHKNLQARWDDLARNMQGDRFVDAAGRKWTNADYLGAIGRDSELVSFAKTSDTFPVARDKGSADERVPLRPEDWEEPRDYADARRRAADTEAGFRAAQSRLYPEVDDADAPRTFAAEIAAVIGGRKPMYHEILPEAAEDIAEDLGRRVPGRVRVDVVDDDHLVVYDPRLVAKIVRSDPDFYRGASLHEAVLNTIRNESMGELLGYGARTMEQTDASTVVYMLDGDRVVAGFVTGKKNAALFAEARTRDYSDYLDRPLRWVLRGPDPR